MSTRALVGIELNDGTVRSSYVHSDGYPDYLGDLLINHYSDPEILREAIELGDASMWDKTFVIPEGCEHSFDNRHDGVSVYYGRDRDEVGIEACTHKSVDAFINNDCDQEFSYVFNVDGLWVMKDHVADTIDYDFSHS